MLHEKHQELFSAFYGSTHKTEYIDEKTSILVGLSAAIALNCYPCMDFYLGLCQKQGISSGAVKDVLAKVMAVSAGQKKAQFEEVLEKYSISLEK